MLSLLAVAVLADIPLGPIKQPGTHELFYRTCLEVEDKLEAGDFGGAFTAAKALPRRTVNIQWDDSAVPAAQKHEFTLARDSAINAIRQAFPEFTIQFAQPPQIKFSFVPELPQREGQALRPGAAYFTSTSPSEPQIEAVIGLKRNNPLMPVEANDIFNEVAYSLVAYYGVGPAPSPGTFAGRSDHSPGRNRLMPAERLAIRNNLRVVDSLQNSIKTKQRVRAARPKMKIDVKELKGTPVVQGEFAPMTFQVTNVGNAPLLVIMRPDCGCVYSDASVSVDPGETALVKAGIDSTEFVGDIRKNIYVFSNDFDTRQTVIPIGVYAKPLFRLVMPGKRTVILEDPNQTVEMFLYLDDDAKLKPKSVSVSGLPAEAKMEPWSGRLADPEIGAQEQDRKGYKITVKLTAPPPAGRHGLSIAVPTDSEKYPTLRSSFFIQSGITSFPGVVFFGEIERQPRRATLLLNRPGKPFKVLRTESDVPSLKATIYKIADDEYKILVELDGKQPAGSLEGTLRIYTDDAKQPIIGVPISGFVQ